MKRPVLGIFPFIIALILCFAASPAPQAAATGGYDVMSAEPAMHAGMHVIFERTAAGASTGGKWHVTVQSVSYPKWVEISWVWPRSDGTLPAATIRRINGLERGRTFGPVFGMRDAIDTDSTAP